MNRVGALASVLVIAIVAVGTLSVRAAAQKTIKDPAEYNAYIAALNETDPAKKAGLMEAFVQQYPQSVVKVDALEQAMAAYQQLADTGKVVDTARRILKIAPDSVRALAIVVFLDRAKATAGDQAALKEGCDYAQSGSRQLEHWVKPEDTTDSDFKKLRNQMAAIFNGALGYCALQAKGFAVAREALTKAVEIDPTNLQDTYQLAIADLLMNPPDVSGFWYCAKAINLARSGNNTAAVDSITGYCKASYKKFHGNEDGWGQVVTDAAVKESLPAGFTVKAKPTAAEIAVQAVQQNAAEDLSFSDKEFILQFRDASPANKDAADKVWASIQAMQKNGTARLSILVKIISCTRDSIDAAITDDNKAANKPDLHVAMEKPMLNQPAPNTETNIIGVITSYTPQPFMLVMEHGELPASKTR
jgi:tetratricopeptide (TPR) repeat protein